MGSPKMSYSFNMMAVLAQAQGLTCSSSSGLLGDVVLCPSQITGRGQRAEHMLIGIKEQRSSVAGHILKHCCPVEDAVSLP